MPTNKDLARWYHNNDLVGTPHSFVRRNRDGEIPDVLQAIANIEEIIAEFPRGLNWKGEVNYVKDLPSQVEIGDAYTVLYKGESGTEPYGAEFGFGQDQSGQYQWVMIGTDTSRCLIRVDYTCDGTHILYDNVIQTFQQVYNTLHDKTKSVHLIYNNISYRPGLMTDSAIYFNEETLNNGSLYAMRIALNTSNVVATTSLACEMQNNRVNNIVGHETDTTKYASIKAICDYINLNKKYLHNISVNKSTAAGSYSYRFSIMNNIQTPYTMLNQVAHYLFVNSPNIRLNVSGTYTENADVYYIIGIRLEEDNMIVLDMRKASDWSYRSMSTGMIEVTDFVQ